MEVKSNTTKGLCKISLHGDMTIYHVAMLKEKLLELLENKKTKEVEINLTDVSEMDTAGFQILVMSKQESKRINKPLSLLAHSQAVRDVLELYNVENFFGDPLVVAG